eukprot:1300390-Amphidinium_carterae.1
MRLAHGVSDSVAHKVGGNQCACCQGVYGSRLQLISHLRPLVSPICRAHYADMPDVHNPGAVTQSEFRLTYTRRGRKRRIHGIPVSDMVVPIGPD